MDATLQQVLTLGGSPLLRATFILVTIVSVVTNLNHVTDAAGAGSRQQALQSITMTVIATYFVTTILQVLKMRIEALSITPPDFS